MGEQLTEVIYAYHCSVFSQTQTFIVEPQIVQCPPSPKYESLLLFSLSDELGRVRLRLGSKKGSDYINASFIDVNTTRKKHMQICNTHSKPADNLKLGEKFGHSE